MLSIFFLMRQPPLTGVGAQVMGLDHDLCATVAMAALAAGACDCD